MKSVSFSAILASFLACASVTTGRVSNPSYTHVNFDVTSGTPVPWYECSAQGNYPDPTTCDHYIACTTANMAYQMPCPYMDDQGNRLHYVQDSGPMEEESYCDYPEFAGCSIGPTTTTTQAPPTPDGPCPEGVIEGSPCNSTVDCHQCGECDWFMRCENDKWVNSICDFKAEADGTIRVSKKLFWNQSSNIHGGICVPWGNLRPELKEDYLADPNCKSTCEYWGDETCLRKYFYIDSNFEKDIWSGTAVALMCEANTKWDQDSRTCVLCSPDDDCELNC